MIAPQPFKYVCPKCGHTRVVKIKSDALTPVNLLKLNSSCPICESTMDKKELNFFDKFFRR